MGERCSILYRTTAFVYDLSCPVNTTALIHGQAFYVHPNKSGQFALSYHLIPHVLDPFALKLSKGTDGNANFAVPRTTLHVRHQGSRGKGGKTLSL